MKRVFIVSIIIFIIMLTGCSSEHNSKNYYNLERFESDMKDKGYNYEVKDVSKDFLPTRRKRLIFDDIALDIYIFKSTKNMESEASNINNDGFIYNNGSKLVNVSWISIPHFYKKGTLIVQYVGENVNIISDLNDILGEPFAGQKLR